MLIFVIELTVLGAASPPPSFMEDLFKGDTNHDQRISKKEFIWPAVLFDTFDQNKDGFITRNEAKTLLPTSSAELKELWAYGLISRRTGTPLIEPAGEHQLDRTKVSYCAETADGYRTIEPLGQVGL